MVINNIRIIKHSGDTEQNLYLVKNIKTNRYVRLGSRETKYLLLYLAQNKAIVEMGLENTVDLNSKEKIILEEKFQQWGFTKEEHTITKQNKQLNKINLLEFNVSKVLDVIYPIYSCLFSKGALVFLILVSVFDIGYFLYAFYHIDIDAVKNASINFTVGIGDMAFVYIYMMINTVFHEFAHAVTCIKYGGQVTDMGLLLYYFIPCFYCDVSSVYEFEDKNKRSIVAIAGVLSNLFISLVTILIAIICTRIGILNVSFTLLFAAFVEIFVVMYNLIPFVKLDGYWLLQSILNIDNLMDKSVVMLYTILFRKTKLSTLSISRWKKIILSVLGGVFLFFSEAFWITTYIFVKKLFSFNPFLHYVVVMILTIMICWDFIKLVKYCMNLIKNNYDRILLTL